MRAGRPICKKSYELRTISTSIVIDEFKNYFLEISAITADFVVGEPVVKFQLSGNNKCSTIPCDSPLQEPLMYPLLFLCGELGWSSKIGKAVSFNNYMSSRILNNYMSSRILNSKILSVMNKIDSKLLPTNRFQILSRLSQMYLVDQISRHIDKKT